MTSGSTHIRSNVPLLLLAAGLFVLHMLCNGNYGFHRDELQVLVDGRHLAWGYVAYPPLTPFLARIDLALFGTSLAGFRMFSAMAQSLAVLLAGLMARELGGGRGSQFVAALCVAFMPFSMLAGSQFMYVSCDFLGWVAVAWLVLRRINSEDQRWWLPIGVAVGLGMLNRYTMLFCVAGLTVGVLGTPLRRDLRSPWLWAGVALSVLIFLPNLVWQVRHDFVYLDFVRHIHERDVRIGRTGGFFWDQLYGNASVFTLPIWLMGLGYLARAKRAARYRILAWIYLVALLLFALVRSRGYYMAPAYPMLLAAGSVAGAAWFCRMRPGIAAAARGVVWALLFLAAASSAVVGLPVASVNSVGWRISRAAHDNFAEQIGWRELVAEVSRIYHAMPAGQRKRTGILALNYGEAGAVDLYGPRFGLPAAISGVNSFWYRGFGDPPPRTLIVLGANAQGIRKAPATCRIAGHVGNRYGVVNEESRDHPQIFVCRNLAVPWPQIWKRLRSFG